MTKPKSTTSILPVSNPSPLLSFKHTWFLSCSDFLSAGLHDHCIAKPGTILTKEGRPQTVSSDSNGLKLSIWRLMMRRYRSTAHGSGSGAIS